MGKKFDNMDKPLPMFDPVHERPINPLDPATVRADDWLWTCRYYLVKEVKSDSVLLEDREHGSMREVKIPDITKDLSSASYYDPHKIIRVSLTEMIDILTTTWTQPFTVGYVKKDGQERVLTGYLLRSKGQVGKSLAIDLNLPKEKCIRWVNHLTLTSLITGGTLFKLR